MVALIGLGSDPAEDAVHPVLIADAYGSPTTGAQGLRHPSDAGTLPPVSAFWSVTMYVADGFQVANELDASPSASAIH